MNCEDGTIDPQKLLPQLPAVGRGIACSRPLSSNVPPIASSDANFDPNQRQNASNALSNADISSGDPIAFRQDQSLEIAALSGADLAGLSTVFPTADGLYGYPHSFHKHLRDLPSTELVHVGPGAATEVGGSRALFDPLAQHACSGEAVIPTDYAYQFLSLLDGVWSSSVAKQASPHQVDHFDGMVPFNSHGPFGYNNSNSKCKANNKALAQAAASSCCLPLSEDTNMQIKSFGNINSAYTPMERPINPQMYLFEQSDRAYDAESVDSWEANFDNPIFSQRRLSEPLFHVLGDPAVDSNMHLPSSTRTSFTRRHSDKLLQKPSLRSDLTFIMEPGSKSQSHKNPTRIKGRRSGPLAISVRQNARKVRERKSICIRCKKDRQPCARLSDGPCTYCISKGLTSKWTQPCTKANFLEVVQSGTCNYISQRAVNHLTLDGDRRIRINLPEILDLDELLKTLGQCQHSFDIRARQAHGSLYVLNLKQCHRYLTSIRGHQEESRMDLRKFIDHDILKADSWQECVNECAPLENLMACLSVWGNMPSRATYSYVSRGRNNGSATESERDMDVDDPEDRNDIIMAAQLSRIICRKLEVDAYSHLQQALNQWSALQSHELLTFVHELGRVLLTLRWRVSWWTLLGDGGLTPDPKGKEAFAYRVHSLCRVLYFYYCMLRGKLPNWHSQEEFHGVWSAYPDTTLPVFEDFPGEDSIEGFEAWMLRGQKLIVIADVESKLANVGLRNERVNGGVQEGSG